CPVPIEVAMKRILVSRPKLKFYEAGMDLNLSNDIFESYRMFQAAIIEQNELMAEQEGFTIIDGYLDIEEQQEKVRETVSQLLPANSETDCATDDQDLSIVSRRTRKAPARPLDFYGEGIPYLKDLDIRGRLIVIEGPDGSGRSTQIDMIISKLEADGHGVLNTGLKRSDLIHEGIL